MKKQFLVIILVLSVFLSSCGFIARDGESDSSQVFAVPGYNIELTCPAGWEQTETSNFDLKLINDDGTIQLSVFGYMEIDLNEDTPPEDLFQIQNSDLLDKRDNVAAVEEPTVVEKDGRLLYSALYSGERDGSKNYYYMNMVHYTQTGHIAWILFNGVPSSVTTNRETLDQILETVKPAEQE
jgi:hypothetical protein